MTLIRAGQWQLTLAPKSSLSPVLSLIGKLASSKPSLFVLDGGNCFNVFEVAQAVNGDLAILERIKMARGFTCYEVMNLLETTSRANTTIVVLDFLATFYDESIPFAERSQLLTKSLTHLQRLNRENGLWVVAYPPALPSAPATNLIKKLVYASNEIWLPEVIAFESEGDPDMGKTLPSFTQLFDQIHGSLSRFRRGLLRPAQQAFDTLFAKARNYAGNGGLAGRPLPFETILLCMLIEHQQELERLQEQLNDRK